jgi:hypothetical protein
VGSCDRANICVTDSFYYIAALVQIFFTVVKSHLERISLFVNPPKCFEMTLTDPHKLAAIPCTLENTIRGRSSKFSGPAVLIGRQGRQPHLPCLPFPCFGMPHYSIDAKQLWLRMFILVKLEVLQSFNRAFALAKEHVV